MALTQDFAGNCIAHGTRGGNMRWMPGRPHDWTDTDVVAVVERDGTWHAYLIDDVQRDDFAAWARRSGGWADIEGEFDAAIRFEPTADWEA